LTKNVHLIPVPIQDIVIQLENSSVGENEKMALLQRLEVIKDFCIKALNRQQRKDDEVNKKKTTTRIVKIKKKM
jgi:hypothetical protein